MFALLIFFLFEGSRVHPGTFNSSPCQYILPGSRVMDSDRVPAAEQTRDRCDFNIIELQKAVFKVTLRLA